MLLSPLVAVLLAWEGYKGGAIRRRFVAKYGPEVQGILLYSNSPNWQSYIETNWIPKVGDRLVVMNWSERSTWKDSAPMEASVIRHHLGGREFNPAVIIFRKRAVDSYFRDWIDGVRRLDPARILAPGTPSIIAVRFFQAFRDYKHGREHALRAAEARMWEALGLASTVDT